MQGATLDVADGEFVAIVGPTGCGKSTLLNVTAGLFPPSVGEARIFGANLAGLNRQSGYLFQSEALFPWKTAIENVAIGLETAGTPRDEARKRAQEWLNRVGLGSFGPRYPHMLSGGQRKRVGLAQVLIRDPKILLMDEPFGPLDAQTRQIMGNLLLDLWSADRKAVMFVTHDLEEAIALSDRVVIMSAGPAARIIGNWKVELPRPRDISEVKLDPGVPQAASRHLADAEGRSAQRLRADGGRVMPSRTTLLILQLLVAVVAIGLWHVLTTVPIFGVKLLPPFFFSTPLDVACARGEVVRRRHDLEASLDHADRGGARLRHRLGRGRADRFLVRAEAADQRGVRSLRQDDERAAARGAGADLRAVARASASGRRSRSA